jgi:hypothetical protein
VESEELATRWRFPPQERARMSHMSFRGGSAGKRTRRRAILAMAVSLAAVGAMAFAARALEMSNYLSRALTDPSRHAAWQRLWSGWHAPAWIARYQELHGAESPKTTAAVEGATYEVFTACKPNDCWTELAIMFSPGAQRAYAAVGEYHKEPVFVGGPDPAQEDALRDALGR